MQIIKRARIPPCLHSKSNHVYTVWRYPVLQSKIRKIFAAVDSTRLSHGQSSYHHQTLQITRKSVKISICADMKRQIICGINIRRRRRHDGIDFTPLLGYAARLAPVRVVVADRGYGSEDNHIMTENLGIQNTIIRGQNTNPCMVWKTKQCIE